MHLKFSLLLLFTSLTILWCYHRDWPTHHCHTIRVKLVFRSPIQECEIIPFLLDTGTVCGHLACWISFCLKAKSGRRGIGLALVPAALLFPRPQEGQLATLLLCAFEENVDPTHTSPLYQIYPSSVGDPTDPTSAASQTEGSDSVKSGGWCQVELRARTLSLACVSQRSIWNVPGCGKTKRGYFFLITAGEQIINKSPESEKKEMKKPTGTFSLFPYWYTVNSVRITCLMKFNSVFLGDYPMIQ